MSIAQTIKKMANDAVNANNPLQFVEGVVHSPPPNIQLRLKSSSKLIIPSEFIIVSEHLTRHTRTANITSSNISSSMASAGDPSHTHGINSLTLRSAKIEFTDELKKGDKVMVAAVQGGQSFFIIDRFKG
ncbi:DUF2577 domain-containing protein [Lentibacillus sp. N15]|uniref:DUF2577 domain-containing protein n=1 Tax=Lentibacillus songyuanensis TaxID=3136161 RepID=UPI0031B9ACDD